MRLVDGSGAVQGLFFSGGGFFFRSGLFGSTVKDYYSLVEFGKSGVDSL